MRRNQRWLSCGQTDASQHSKRDPVATWIPRRKQYAWTESEPTTATIFPCNQCPYHATPNTARPIWLCSAVCSLWNANNLVVHSEMCMRGMAHSLRVGRWRCLCVFWTADQHIRASARGRIDNWTIVHSVAKAAGKCVEQQEIRVNEMPTEWNTRLLCASHIGSFDTQWYTQMHAECRRLIQWILISGYFVTYSSAIRFDFIWYLYWLRV